MEDGFSRLLRLAQEQDAREAQELQNPKEEKEGGELAAPGDTSAVAINNVLDGSQEMPEINTADAVNEVVKPVSSKPVTKDSFRKKTNPPIKDVTQFGYFYFKLPRRKRSLLKFVSVLEQKSMNVCMLEALDAYLGAFEIEFKKRYKKNAEVLEVFSELFDK